MAKLPQQKILLESDTNELEIVEFVIDSTEIDGTTKPCYFGVNVAKVREILRKPELSKVFQAHPAIAGVMQLRDKVLTVIDLGTALDTAALNADRIIVLEFNRMTIGVLVNSVTRIYRLSWEQIDPPAGTMTSSYVTGMVKMEDRIILILDFEKILGEVCATDALQPLSQEQLSANPFDRAKYRILVVDDSSFIRTNVISALEGSGYKTLSYVNGEDAWKGLCSGETPDLIITDIEMPKMDGLHFTSLVRKEEKFKNIPILIFSSLASDDNIRKWEKLGANGILTKPDLPNLVRITDEYLAKR